MESNTAQAKGSRKLNLGCGWHPKAGYVNVDYSDVYPADIVHDLDKFPWPFADNQFELVEMDHVLEHLNDVRGVIGELERIMVPGGLVIIRVPHFSRGFTHWDHKRGFDFTFMIYFDPRESGGFTGSRLEPVRTRLTWFAQPHVKKEHLGKITFALGSIAGTVLDYIGNLNLFFTSRILCYWVGGFDEIAFTLRKKENGKV